MKAKPRLRSGDIISCRIHATYIPKALVMLGKVSGTQIEKFFLLQDYRNGCSIEGEKYGFKCSWQIGDGSPDQIEAEGVRDIIILNRKKMNHEE